LDAVEPGMVQLGVRRTHSMKSKFSKLTRAGSNFVNFFCLFYTRKHTLGVL